MQQPETQITVMNFTLDVRLDGVGCLGGTIVRNPDGIEARFNNPECLAHLLEGLIGRRAWQVHGPHIETQIRTTLCTR